MRDDASRFFLPHLKESHKPPFRRGLPCLALLVKAKEVMLAETGAAVIPFSSTFKRCVLGLARTGLTFTRIQEGTQLGGLNQPQPGQTEPGIPYHVPSCWVPVGGAARG